MLCLHICPTSFPLGPLNSGPTPGFRAAMQESRLNRRHRWNQRLIRRALAEQRLVRSISMEAGGKIHIESSDWDDYWCGCAFPASLLGRLEHAWRNLIVAGHGSDCRRAYVSAYFALLKWCLNRDRHRVADFQSLRKVVGFETFLVNAEDGHSVGGIFNVRNPAYSLCKVAQPHVFDDPKFLPLICPFSSNPRRAPVFFHYRRIPIADTGGVQLYLYPPADHSDHSDTYRLIAKVFHSLSTNGDPWVKRRSDVVFGCALEQGLDNNPLRSIRMLDIGCGSGGMAVALSRKLHARYRIATELTLVDVVGVNRALEDVFYRNPAVFRRLTFRRADLAAWLEHRDTSLRVRFDVALLLRVLNVFSRFSIERLSSHETAALLCRDRVAARFDRTVLDPSALIESASQHKIQHTIKKTGLRGGSAFYQLSLSEYFKAMRIVQKAGWEEGTDMVHVPVRRFDEAALVLPSGRSLIGRLLEMSRRVLLEDADLTASHMREHLSRFGLERLLVRDLSDRHRMRGASVVMVERRD